MTHAQDPLALRTAAQLLAPVRPDDLGETSGVWSRRERLLRLQRTVRPIPLAQLAARARFRTLQQLYKRFPAAPIRRARRATAGVRAAEPLPSLPPELVLPVDVAALSVRTAALAAGRFGYLGREADFRAGVRWRDPAASPLWVFNLQYLGAVLELVVAERTAAAQRLLASWASAFQHRWDPVAWHPYPVSVRLINLCLAAAHHRRFEALGDGAIELTSTHAAYLLDHLEYDLRGNHLMENACALLFAARFLRGPLASRCDAVARRLLVAEVPEQILPDGAHFELSPMYHTIVMHRLLQVIALLGRTDPLVGRTLAPAVARMARFLGGVLCPDGDIPLLGDSARGFGPPASTVLDHAARLGLSSAAPPSPGITSFRDSGLHVFRSRRLWAVFDAGPVCPAYQPGHGQADSLTVEVWCDGVCIVGDPGVHEYTGPERAWGRSSRAHSTMTIDDADTSEVYGSFRVGGRARVTEIAADYNAIAAVMEPFGLQARLTRTVRLHDTSAQALEIVDSAAAPPEMTVRSRLHLHPAVQLAEGPTADGRCVIVRGPAGAVRIEAEQPLELERGRASRQYGLIEPTLILVQTLAAGAPAAGSVRGATYSIVPLGGA